MNSIIIQLIEEELYSTHNLSESTQQFIERLTQMVMQEFKVHKTYNNCTDHDDLIEELRFEISTEILRFFRLKTYGYYDLSSFRRSLVQSKLQLSFKD